MTTILGIDEAGRGPVIGPLVIAGAAIDPGSEKKLVKLGVKDSKLLSPSVRENLFEKIISAVKTHKVIVIEPLEIDATLEAEDDNLNWLEAKKSAQIINELVPNIAYIDCPSNNVKAYTNYILELLNVDTKLVAEHKADAKYPVVSAASILAKVVRDTKIEEIKKSIGIDFGSGYPSDPKTQEFLARNYKKYPGIFRKSWASYKAVAHKASQTRLGEF